MIIRAKCWKMLSVQEKMFILNAVCNKQFKLEDKRRKVAR